MVRTAVPAGANATLDRLATLLSEQTQRLENLAREIHAANDEHAKSLRSGGGARASYEYRLREVLRRRAHDLQATTLALTRNVSQLTEYGPFDEVEKIELGFRLSQLEQQLRHCQELAAIEIEK